MLPSYAIVAKACRIQVKTLQNMEYETSEICSTNWSFVWCIFKFFTAVFMVILCYEFHSWCRECYSGFCSVENSLFLMYVLVGGLRGNLDREEFQRCFMNAFSCVFNLAKLKYNDLQILHFILQIIKLPNSFLITWHAYVLYWHACMSLASRFTFWTPRNGLLEVNNAFI